MERIYGIHNGGDRKSEPNNFGVISTQKELASVIGISDETLRNYKKLTELIPEIADLVDTGVVTPTTALSIVKNIGMLA